MIKRGKSTKESRKNKEEDIAPAEVVPEVSKIVATPRPQYTNRQRILVIASRGINARFRHLLEDFKKLLPHHKKDNKLDSKGDIQAVNEIAEINSCNQVLYLECRKRQDLYLYLAKAPSGPSVKFHVVNIHTMDELKLTGNCMLGSRPLLSFDANFDSSVHMQLIKSLLTNAFGTPLGHPKAKPFVDRIMSFFLIKNHICINILRLSTSTY
jgi:ribosome biogenesis protein BRX1